MSTRVKICGLTTQDDLAATVATGADAIGVVVDVTVDTPRELSPDAARSLVDAAPPFVDAVLVTMPESVAEAVELCEAVGPDCLQVHGLTDPSALAELSDTIAGDLLVAVDADSVESLEAITAHADAILIDSLDPDGAGGTGETHDWDRTRRLTADLEIPIILAGGLSPETVGSAIESVQPYAVDVSSGVEAAPGEKDHTAVRAFVETAHQARTTAIDQ
ncbi:MAG: phosphoribosylanthranilate isomerase [Natrialbaceae archaeon]|nr:phosphoribosylanthranilate isomerase [Natrialbaceae archaeon]